MLRPKTVDQCERHSEGHAAQTMYNAECYEDVYLTPALNVWHPQNAAAAILMLAPILLLLSQDPLLLPGLGDRQRYLPPMLAISVYLPATAVLEVRVESC